MDYNNEISSFSFTTNTLENTPNLSINNAIGISVYKSGTDGIHSNYVNKKFINSNNTFVPATSNDEIVLTSATGKVDFIAYYPYKQDLFEDYHIDLSDQSSQEAIDILYSNNAKEKNYTSKNIDIVFNHQLSKLVIFSTPGKGLTEEDLIGMSVTIDNIYNKASLNIYEGVIKPYGEKTSIKMKTEVSGYKSEVILIPGSFSNIGITITLFNSTIYKTNLFENINFIPQVIHFYNAKINKKEISISKIEIEDWSGAENAPDTIPTNNIIYKVGDFYPNPFNATTAIGLVYFLKPGSKGREGKIVSFDTSEKKWSEINNFQFKIDNIILGLLNLAIAKAIDSSLELFPAFKWCNDKGEGWYLPSRHELHILNEEWIKQKDSINNKILMVNGEIFTTEDVYLTSSESRSEPKEKAESYSFIDKGWPSSYKTIPVKIRAVKIF